MSVFGKPFLTGVGKGSASGAVASFTDGAKGLPLKSLLVDIDPVQDLHGYENPWPAGGGKNLFNTDFESPTVINGTTITKLADGRVTTNAVPSASFDFVIGTASLPAGDYILNGCPANGGATKYRLQVTDYPVVNNLGQDNGSGVSFTLSEAMTVAVRIQLYTGASSSLTFSPMIRLASVTDATYAPYSNICPISGWSAVNVWRTGKNLLDDSQRHLTLANIYFGGATAQSGTPSCVLPAGTYTFSVETADGTSTNLYAFSSDGTALPGSPAYNKTSLTFAVSHQMGVIVRVYKDSYTNVNDIRTAQIELGSTATAYEPYSGNQYTLAFPHGILGNVWDEEWEVGSLSTVDGSPVYGTQSIRSKNFCKCLPSTEYYIKCGNYSVVYYMAVYWFDENKNFVRREYTAGTVDLSPENAYYFKIVTNNNTYVYGTTYNHDISINYPSTVTTYNPYATSNTVYGGTLDVTNGVLTVDRAAVDMSALSWSLSILNRWKSDSLGSTAKYPPNNTTATTAMSESLKSLSMSAINADSLTTGIAFYNAIDGIFARNGSTTEPPTGKLVYELATPITIPLTPQEISTLQGANNLWVDTGDVTVEYLKQSLMHIGSSVLI